MSWKQSEESLGLFIELANSQGVEVKKSTRQQDIQQHIDGFLTFPTEKPVQSFDYKSRKRVKRGDSSFQDELVWIEFKNVQGKRGWLNGDADLIIFEREKDYIFVSRDALRKLSEVLVDFDKKVATSKDALYASYTRRGRKDVISMIKMSDVLSLDHEVWKKS